MKSNRNYPLLLASQFLGAFGDNAILAVIVGQLTLLQKAGQISQEELRQRGTIYTSILFIPYVLLAPLAGFLNDRHAKTSWLRGGNLLKLLGTAICALSIWYGYAWQGIGYFIVGIGSTMYGPAKYGILPEILPREKLVKANGMVELLTLLAILFGAIGGSVIVDRLPVSACYGVLLGIFAASLGLNLLMTRSPSNPNVHLAASVGEFFQHFGGLLRSPRLGKVLIGTALFWVCGASMKINFQPWGLDVLKLPDNTQIALLGLWLSVGVMIGSIGAGMLYKVGDLRHTRWFGFALAALLAVVFAVEPLGLGEIGRKLIETVKPDGTKSVALVVLPAVMVLLAAAGVAAGLFLIPLNAALQAESDPQKLGKTIAVQNFTDNCGMILAGLIVFVCVQAHLSASQVFLVLAGLVTCVVAWLRIPAKREA
ncbi:MAG TPA: MFS transporter [Candidatus Limnocylindria bacterium]|nr:MFS transporter [Candidatus Limnocylindria bacterium]